MSRKVVIVGVGNILLKDEGLGVHVARALQAMNPGQPDCDVQVVDGGTSPDAFDAAHGADKLIIVDAAQGGGEPGAIYRLRPGDLFTGFRLLTSLHDLGVSDALRMMEILGNPPRETVIIGVEPAEIGWGTELTPALQARLPEIVRVVAEELASCENQTAKAAR